MTFTWSEEASRRLVALWNANASGSEIARALSSEFRTSISRNAVMGEISRLRRNGIQLRVGGRRYAPPKLRPPARPKPAAPPRKRRRPPPLPEDPAQVPAQSNIAPPDWPPIGHCIWLYGDVHDGTARFCAAPVRTADDGEVRRYCPYHDRIAFQPKGDHNAA